MNAIDKVKEGVVDALICRFASRMQARALLEQLAELQSDVCVIFLGRDLGASEVAYLLQRGAFDYLTLPLDIDRAMEAVGQGLRNRDAFIDVRNFSSSLAKANEILAGERHLPKQWNRSLAALNRLIQALSGSLESEAVIRTLFNSCLCDFSGICGSDANAPRPCLDVVENARPLRPGEASAGSAF